MPTPAAKLGWALLCFWHMLSSRIVRGGGRQLAGIEIDSRNPHLWLIRYPVSWTANDYEELVEESIRLNPEKIRHAVVMDMRDSTAKGATNSARTQAAAVMKTHEVWLTEVLVCAVRVTPNPILRGSITVYDWLSPAKWPRKSVSNGLLAEAWARSKLAAAGISCAPEPVWCDVSNARARPSAQGDQG